MRSISEYIRKLNIKVNENKVKILLGIILLFALFLRLHFFVGLNWSDDVGYVADAHRISKGNFSYPDYNNALRWMILHPVALSFAIFGVSNFTAALYPLICSLVTILLGFYLGKLLVGKEVGLITAFLISFFPLNVIYSTWIMIDVPIALFTNLSIFLILKGEKDNKGKLIYFLSGCSIGVAYLHRISGLLAFLFIIPYILYKTISKREINLNYTFIFIGFILIFTLEGLFYLSNTGNFLLRYDTVSGHYAGPNSIEKHGLNPSLTYYPHGLLNLNSNLKFNWNNKNFVHYGLFYYFVIFSGIYAIVKKHKEVYPVILWVVIFFLYSEFGTMSLTSYIPIHKLYRHLTVLTLPSLLILSDFLVSLGHKKSGLIRKGLSISLLAFLLITSLYYTYYRHAYLREGVADQKEIYDFLQKEPKNTIYGDGGTIGHLKFYSKFEWNKRLKTIYEGTSCKDLKDSYIVIDSTRGWVEKSPYNRKLPNCVKNEQEDWIHVKTIKASNLGIYKTFNPKIYYVPT